MTPEQINAAIDADAAGANLGLATLADAGRSGDIAQALNATSGDGSGPVSRGRVPLDDPDVAEMLAATLINLANPANAGKVPFYTLMVHVLTAVGAIYTDSPSVAALMAQAVADEMVSQADATAVATRPGSLAEVLHGPGTVVTVQAVDVALKARQDAQNEGE